MPTRTKILSLGLLSALLVSAAHLASQAGGPGSTPDAPPARPAAAAEPIAPPIPRFSVTAVNLPPAPPEPRSARGDLLSLQARLGQGKVLAGGPGLVTLALDLQVAEPARAAEREVRATDFVVVLDLSGSMAGDRIATARAAITALIHQLRPEDRFGFVTFASEASTPIALSTAQPRAREAWAHIVGNARTGGSTNLEGGLRRGLDELRGTEESGRARRLLLLSDGQANVGMTEARDLAEVATAALAQGSAITTLGIGHGFSEDVMTAVAEAGAGNAYYLPEPAHLDRILAAELHGARNTCGRGTIVHVTTAPGVVLVDGGGYPLEADAAGAMLRPGDLLAGQDRSLFLTFQVPVTTPTEAGAPLALGSLTVHFDTDDGRREVTLAELPTVICTEDAEAVIASIDRPIWERTVASEGFGKLQVRTARLVARGCTAEAEGEVRQWLADHEAVNAHVVSARVAATLVEARRLAVRIRAARTPQARNLYSKEQLYSGKGMRRESSWLSWD